MDSIVNTALEEICSQGESGILLQFLWSRLEFSILDSNLDLSPGVKTAIWNRLLLIPALQFGVDKLVYSPTDPSIQSFEDAQTLNLKVVAREHLRDNFLGLYNVPSANASMSSSQRRTLERLAVARTNGATQSQLAKEFGKEGRNYFYVVKSLEDQGLIVRHSAVVRTKEALIEGENENTPSVTTNLMYLYRYATHLGSQQRFEITKEEHNIRHAGHSDEGVDGFPLKCVKEEVVVKDYLPEMKAICEKLEEANGKVLVVSDLKKDCGYTGSSSGHKRWRRICDRLTDANIVEEFTAKVNGKVDQCLKLLKKFSLGCLEQDNSSSGHNIVYNKLEKFGRNFQITEQLVELPIEQQIYDLINAAGSMGLTMMEVFKRLGIDQKRNYSRLVNMLNRFGMHLQAENHKRSTIYRVWASGNFKPEFTRLSPHKSIGILSENENSNNRDVNINDLESSVQTSSWFSSAILRYDNSNTPMTKDAENSEDLNGSSVDGASNHMIFCSSEKLLLQPNDTIHGTQHNLLSDSFENDSGPSRRPLEVLKSSSSESYQRYPCLSLTMDSARREQIILERLQDVKFILVAELYRSIVSQETNKETTMDRKTIYRIINELQQQGRCKCIKINVPAVTNCGRNRITQVVLHPSVQTLTPQLLSEIHDRLRSFEVQIRAHSSAKGKNNESIPELKEVQRTQNYADSKFRAVRSEAMRANGFVFAKMIRAKLLHNFLWDYLNGSDGILSSKLHAYDLQNPYTTCKLFSLEAAIKFIPIELFLQVVGSTDKIDNMDEKYKGGLCLSDLAPDEYKDLMDTKAIGRLSLIVDILRRLKLIRMVTEHPEDTKNDQLTTFQHALELKPYIEEPLSKEATSLCFRFSDLRPRVRHDFILSNRAALDEYWQTLEYCYVAADPRAALLSFPGSAVHEVSYFRSWASVRVMTADQRTAILERIAPNDLGEKLSYKKCEKIANDLNLTLEQVLRAYYDKRRYLSRLQGKVVGSQQLRSKSCSFSKQKNKPPEGRSSKRARYDSITGALDKRTLVIVSGAVDQPIDEGKSMDASSEDRDIYSQALHRDCQEPDAELGPTEDDGDSYFLLRECNSSKRKRARERRFFWTDEADRKLVIQYTRHRVALGVKYHRLDWNSVPDLPAPPNPCRKRMALLNSSTGFRKAVMRLCNVLSKRYSKHLETIENESLSKDDDGLLLRGLKGKSLDKRFHDIAHKQDAAIQKESWDDFDDKVIKIAINNALCHRRLDKLEAFRKVESGCLEVSDPNLNPEGWDNQKSILAASVLPREGSLSFGVRQEKIYARRSHRRLHLKFIKILNRELKVNLQVYESLAVSNAVELFKLVFLSTSMASEASNLLPKILRHYSEHDLFAAFNYLREKRSMIGGETSQPFVLSQQFLRSISKSPFPSNSGKRALKFAKWLADRDKNIMEGGINLTDDLQCGDIFHLFGLVSSGELALSPFLPDEGVGEPDDSRNLKRKINSHDFWGGYRTKLMKSVAGEGEVISRREKGFPGIMVSVVCDTFAKEDALELFKTGNTGIPEQHYDETNVLCNTASQTSSPCDQMKDIFNSHDVVTHLGSCSKSLWETVAAYTNHLNMRHTDKELIGICPEIFEAVYTAIQKVGDQGLCMEEVSRVINLPGDELPELIVDALQMFQRVLKVNAFDTLRVVDVLYRSKYFFTSIAIPRQEHKPSISVNVLGRNDGCSLTVLPVDDDDTVTHTSEKEISMIVGDVHKVTILNFTEEDIKNINNSETCNDNGSSHESKAILTGGSDEDEVFKLSSGELCMPIFPWINGDGTLNELVYKGLRRRIIGIVMQNPGISEVDIIHRMDVLNPQSCRKLLELMILDKHLRVRKMYQSISNSPPGILKSILGSSYTKSKFVFGEHLFANPTSTSLL